MLSQIAVDKNYDDILMQIKETCVDADDEWSSSHSEYDGLRMISASRLYASGIETRFIHYTVDGSQFWCRQFPSFKAKLRECLDPPDLDGDAICVGTQLGTGHKRSCNEFEPSLVERYFVKNKVTIVELAQLMNKELFLVFEGLERSEEFRSSFQHSFKSVA